MSEQGRDPNPTPPSDDPSFQIVTPGGATLVTVEDLRALPARALPGSYIVSTGHGTSGPFMFEGTTLGDVIARYAGGGWSAAMVVSADGFGTRVRAEEWREGARREGARRERAWRDGPRPILLAYAVDGHPLTRAEGLVRLIVPTETDEALRQIKWVGGIRLE